VYNEAGRFVNDMAQTGCNRKNLLVFAVILVVSAGLLLPYVGYLHARFWVWAGVSSLAGAYFAAFELGTRRLALLAAIAAAMGYLAQTAGRSLGGVWSFESRQVNFLFVPAVFVLTAILASGATEAWLGPLLRQKVKVSSRAGSALAVVGLFVLMILFPGSVSVVPGFWPSHGVMAVLCVLIALRTNTATLLAMLASGMLTGIAAEHALSPGKLSWLTIGSWALAMLLCYGLSGIFADEPLVARPTFRRAPATAGEAPPATQPEGPA
jgi:hypothetical protein